MPIPTDEALRQVQAALTTQNHRFAAFVEAFSELPADTRLDVDPAVLDAIEATSSELPQETILHTRTLGALRA